jgi:hypothetical protein
MQKKPNILKPYINENYTLSCRVLARTTKHMLSRTMNKTHYWQRLSCPCPHHEGKHKDQRHNSAHFYVSTRWPVITSLHPKDSSHCAHWTGSLLGLRANPGIWRKISILSDARNWTLDHPDYILTSISTTPSQLPHVSATVFNHYLAAELYLDNEAISHQENTFISVGQSLQDVSTSVMVTYQINCAFTMFCDPPPPLPT